MKPQVRIVHTKPRVVQKKVIIAKPMVYHHFLQQNAYNYCAGITALHSGQSKPTMVVEGRGPVLTTI